MKYNCYVAVVILFIIVGAFYVVAENCHTVLVHTMMNDYRHDIKCFYAA
jgi:hypothetical protein